MAEIANFRDDGTLSCSDFQLLFEASPHPYLVLRPDPTFTIAAVNDRYLEVTRTRRDEVLGHGLFEVFPDNPDDRSAMGVSDLRSSLERVLRDRAQDVMGVQKYDIPRRNRQVGFEVKYWSPVNTPVLGNEGNVAFIIHHVEDVTEYVLAQQRWSSKPNLQTERLPERVDRMEAEVLRRATDVKEANRRLKAAMKEGERRLLAEIEKRAALLDALMEYIPEGITIADAPDVTIRMVSRYGQRLTARRRTVLEGIPAEQHVQAWDIYHADGVTPGKPEELPLTRAVKKGEVVTDEEWVLRRPDGEQIPILCNAGPIRGAGGEITGGVIAWRDARVIKVARRAAEQRAAQLVAEQKAAELAMVNRRLDEANKELEAFSYSVSHDLRAPLRAMDGFSKVLLQRYSGLLDEQGAHYLQRIRTGSQRMGLLIDDLLTLSRVARWELHCEQIDLSEQARVIAAELKKTQPEREVEFAVAPGMTAHGDTRLIQLVLENLLGNAWKFTSRRPRASIEFAAIERNGKRVYVVRDNGAGFDMAYDDKLFGAFQRLHSESEFPGTGIGLATVQRIVHRHGGRVWAEGQVDRGATFYFTLEVCQGAVSAAGDDAKRLMARAEGAQEAVE